MKTRAQIPFLQLSDADQDAVINHWRESGAPSPYFFWVSRYIAFERSPPAAKIDGASDGMIPAFDYAMTIYNKLQAASTGRLNPETTKT